MMNKILKGLKGVLVFMDDILIFSKSLAELYIYNIHFILYTNHKPLIYSGKIENNRRVLKWKHRLSDMSYEIRFKA